METVRKGLRTDRSDYIFLHYEKKETVVQDKNFKKHSDVIQFSDLQERPFGWIVL